MDSTLVKTNYKIPQWMKNYIEDLADWRGTSQRNIAEELLGDGIDQHRDNLDDDREEAFSQFRQKRSNER